MIEKDGYNALVLENNDALLFMLFKTMYAEGILTRPVISGSEAMEALNEEPFDLILADIDLPKGDGFEIVRMLREKAKETPLIIVSRRGGDSDVVNALNLGADEYIIKPINPVTLGAKVKALLRRRKILISETQPSATPSPFTYDNMTLRFYKNDVEIPLTAKENIIMKLFMDNPGRSFTQEELFSLVWQDEDIKDQIVVVYINRLRRKIEEDAVSPKYIQTIRGGGYVFTG